MTIAPPVFRELDAPFGAPLDVLSAFDQLVQLPTALLLYSGTHQQRTPLDSGLAPAARYSFAAANPTTILRAQDNRVELEDTGSRTIVRLNDDALNVARTRTPSLAHIPELPPFQTGWAGVIGYEYGSSLEQIPRPTATHTPDLVLAWYPWTIAWDHWTNRCWLIAENNDTLESANEIVDGLHTRPTPPRRRSIQAPTLVDFESSMSRAQYTGAIERIREYIAQGDVFQVNLSQQFRSRFQASAWDLYRELDAINPAPFSAYFDAGNFTVVSASPERFLHLDEHGKAQTSPIKGTRPRGKTAFEDERLSTELIASEKDRAEHVMIVDVLRNDLSRVSEYGSVRVPSLMRLESYATVHHLVSTVESRLRKDQTAFDLLHASLPGGSITGAPKVRAMEIIAELEPVNRGPYCGAIGYISASGTMDTNIAIRTCTVDKQAQQVTFSAGGGIVYDSNPTDEYQETLDKASALMRAVQAVNAYF